MNFDKLMEFTQRTIDISLANNDIKLMYEAKGMLRGVLTLCDTNEFTQYQNMLLLQKYNTVSNHILIMKKEV